MENKYEIRGDVTVIYLNRNDGTILETTIDTVDLSRAKEHPNTWYSRYDPAARNYYVTGQHMVGGTRKTIQLSRWLLRVEGKLVVDHYDHDTLNNKKSNLRIVTHAQNMQNRNPEITNQYSKVRGVTYDIRYNRWHASLNHNGKRHFFGYFDSIAEADEAVKRGRAVLLPYSKEANEVIVNNPSSIYPDHSLPLRNKIHKAPRGIYWSKRLNKWWVMITHNKTRHDFGYYSSLEEATTILEEKRKMLKDIG